MTDARAPQDAEWFWRGPWRFVAGVPNIEALPAATLPEIVFLGRSNVGKSSLLNAILGQHNVARVSQNPGCTEQLNFFELRESLICVDAPGYGFARKAKHMRDDWQELIHSYLKGRPTLKRACVLVDARHGLKSSDDELFSLLDECALPYLIILTKSDEAKSSLPSVKEQIIRAASSHPALFPEPFVTSSRTGEGLKELRVELLRI